MTRPETKEYCSLCGQPVEIPNYVLNAPTARLRFCCTGCLSIYQLVNKEKLKTTTFNTQLNNKEDTKK